jgi:hypothetical protein
MPAGGWHSHPCGKPAKGNLKNGNPACGVHLAAEKKHDAKYKEYNLFYAEVEHVRNQTGIASLMTCYPSTTMVKMSLEDFNKFWKSLERQKSLTIQALLDDGDDDPPCAF